MSAKDMTLINATDGYYRMTGYTREESLLPPFSRCDINLVLPEEMGRRAGAGSACFFCKLPIQLLRLLSCSANNAP